MSRKRKEGGTGALVVLIIAILMAGRNHLPVVPHSFHPASHSVRAKAIAWARQQEGCPYLYGGTSCGTGFDCSGLIMKAYAHAGRAIPRTSEDQWKHMHHVTVPRPGDLVFFAGSPIDPPPGHVGLVISRHKMIEAYASGYPVRVSSFGTAGSPPGDRIPTGFAAP